MNTPTSEFLLKLENELEADIRDCLRLLEVGSREALAELQQCKDEAGTTLAEAGKHLRAAADTSRQRVEAIQLSLARLGMALHQFVLADPFDIENLSAFDEWRKQVLSALEDAREELGRIQTQEENLWKSHLETAWRRFGSRLEAVRLHLTLDRDYARSELAAERSRLWERLSRLQDEMRRDPRTARQKIREMTAGCQDDPETSRIEGWLKAIMMWIDSPAASQRREGAESPEPGARNAGATEPE